MELKDILVHVDRTERCRARLDIAFALAQRHEAHLVGLYVESHSDVPDFIPGGSLARASEKARNLGVKLARDFNDRAKQKGISAEWRQVDQAGLGLNDVPDQVIINSHHADLVILGQHDPDSEDAATPDDLPDLVVLGAGRPVLVIPYAGRFDLAEIRALVAWNAGREATRAVNDALPFLKRADKVIVLAVNPRGGRDSGHGDIPCADICTHLARHGVRAEAQHLAAEDVQVGDLLLSRAADEGVNLMVAGAFQRSRVRERVLGGVTRHLLKHMTVPVLMSR